MKLISVNFDIVLNPLITVNLTEDLERLISLTRSRQK